MTTLTLNVLRCPDTVSAEQRQLQGGELTLGRGAECGWLLADPLNTLSRKHCTVEFFAGGWQVRDLSANGTFVNFSTNPIGRDFAQPLRDGDRLRLGDYEIEVRIEEAVAALAQPVSPLGGVAGPSPFDDAPRPSFGSARLPGLDDPVGTPGRFGAPAVGSEVMADHGLSGSDAFVPPALVPTGKPIIPDDWYHDAAPPAPAPFPATVNPLTPVPAVIPSTPAAAPLPFAPRDPVTAPVMPLAAKAPALLTPAAVPVAAGVSAATAGDDMAAALAALMAGGELPPDMAMRAASDPEAALRSAGVLLRAAVTGLRGLLIARGSVKREFRIEQTMLRPRDNNPLKFAASDEQALAALLDPRTPALKAVEESINDLTLHQVATLAATQAAARALLERMGPAVLESEDPGGGLLPGAREKRLWEAYKRRHAKLLEQFEDDFESAFGTAFARAYEQAAGRAKG